MLDALDEHTAPAVRQHDGVHRLSATMLLLLSSGAPGAFGWRTGCGLWSATVRRLKVAVQFVEAGTNRKQAVALSLNLGPDVGVGVRLVTVPAVLPLIGGGALREETGLGDDKAPPRSSTVHEE